MKKLILFAICCTFMVACNPVADSTSDTVSEENTLQSLEDQFFSLSDSAVEEADQELDAADPVTESDRRQHFRSHRDHFRRVLRQALRSQLPRIFDADDNGEMTRAERKTAIIAMRLCRSEIRSFWKDSYEDVESLVEAIVEARLEVKDIYDGDDNEMSEDEIKPLIEDTIETVLATLLERYDADSDNRISAEEVRDSDVSVTGLQSCTPIVLNLIMEVNP